MTSSLNFRAAQTHRNDLIRQAAEARTAHPAPRTRPSRWARARMLFGRIAAAGDQVAPVRATTTVVSAPPEAR